MKLRHKDGIDNYFNMHHKYNFYEPTKLQPIHKKAGI